MSSTRGPSRRDLLIGAAGGAIAAAAEAGIYAGFRGSAHVSGPAGLDQPYILGRSTSDLPAGLVRADVRAFKKGSDSDYHNAFTEALTAAEAVYVPPGTLHVSQGITLPANRVIYADGGLDQRQTASRSGAVIQLTNDIGPGALLSLGTGCEIRGLTVDADGKADKALAIPQGSDECRIWDTKAQNGRSCAFFGDGSRHTIIGCVFEALPNTGLYAYYCSGADLHVVAVRMIGGVKAAGWVNGFYGDYEIVHFQGSSATQNSGLVTRNHNHFVQCRFDGSVGPNLLVQSKGNKFVSCRFYQGRPGKTSSAVRIDGGSGIASLNEFVAVYTDAVSEHTWDLLLEIIGSAENTAGTILTSGSCSQCKGVFNTRPAEVGLVTNSAGLRSRNEFQTALSGNGQTRFTMAHRLLAAPASVVVVPASGDAASSPFHVTSDAANVILVYQAPPPSGSGNLVYNVVAMM